MTEPSGDLAGERADAARNRARLLEAAAWLVAERGAEHVTMREVAQVAGVGKGTLFRRFGDRNGLLLALLDDVEAEFYQAYTFGLPPLGPGAPASGRLIAFGYALLERVSDPTDLGPALGRQVPADRRRTSNYGRAFRLHVTSLLREAGVVGDHTMLAHALLAFVDLETIDHLRNDDQVITERLKATWADLVRRVTGAADC
ncbi:TetR/AcrR family transcriptional regulator [Streptomyces pseudovenezuelae]|uniref:TetR/AcrR family transcriptional regulator n=1 Tax=Streptomyces pseudovenezuelae TaxID=67350 RepID=UPI002E80F5F7|nr:helix-turn-helix domain-containing protein [Streptomyces pseudovenezuelae]WUA91177.1 TetR/AcrR family transcriptional regulator [Streptomyces pseudovenezuelae]